jgi:hypothetical protein
MMDYLKQYRSFISSHYVGEGVRITTGVLVPVLIMAYFDLLPIGFAVGLGALCVSITDNPGPIHHRRNGLLVCAASHIFCCDHREPCTTGSLVVHAPVTCWRVLFFL